MQFPTITPRRPHSPLGWGRPQDDGPRSAPRGIAPRPAGTPDGMDRPQRNATNHDDDTSQEDTSEGWVAPVQAGDRGGDGLPPEGDLRLGVLREESSPPRFRQPAEGAPDHGQGGRGQRARRLRGGRDPPGHPCRAPPARRDEIQGHHPRQRPRHRPEADREHLRQAPLRFEVPSDEDESGPAGHRDLGRRDVRPDDHRTARAHHLQDRKAKAVARGGPQDGHRAESRGGHLRDRASRGRFPLRGGSRHAGDDRARGAVPEGAGVGRRVPRADRDRQSPCPLHLPNAHERGDRVSPRGRRAPTRGHGDQAPSQGDRAGHADPDAREDLEDPAGGVLQGRVLPGRAAGGEGDLREGRPHRPDLDPPGRSRRRGASLQRHPGRADHGAADRLPRPDRDQGDARRTAQGGEGGVLRGQQPARRGLSRQSVPDRGRDRLRRAARRRRPRSRDPVRESSPAPLPAVRVLLLQGGRRDRLEELRPPAGPRGASDRPHRGDDPHGEHLGAVHQRVEGGDRRLRRDPQGDEAGTQGVRPQAGDLPSSPPADATRVGEAARVRPLHRGDLDGLRADHRFECGGHQDRAGDDRIPQDGRGRPPAG